MFLLYSACIFTIYNNSFLDPTCHLLRPGFSLQIPGVFSDALQD